MKLLRAHLMKARDRAPTIRKCALTLRFATSLRCIQPVTFPVISSKKGGNRPVTDLLRPVAIGL